MPPVRHLPKSSEPKVRQRSAKACAPCRKRKIKCDGNTPCAACVGYGYDCIFVETTPVKNTPPIGALSVPVRTGSSLANGDARMTPIATGNDKPDEQFIASESILQHSGGNLLLNQSIKTRFTSSSSSIAFPRNLGISLGITPPRLQSFGWNPGTRQEPVAPELGSICDIISLDQFKLYSGFYFNEVHPFFGILDRELYMVRATAFWIDREQGTDFEAVMCGVVAMGSLFSAGLVCPVEAQIVEHGRLLLDLSTSYAPTLLSMKHVVAWTLRAIYLRSTTRPHLSWLASCTALHTAEAIGLHREFSKEHLRYNPVRHVSALEIDLRRRDFWVALALNQFLSCEYGRTRVSIDSISCLPLVPQDGDFTAQVVEVMQSVPRQQFLQCSVQELLEKLKATAEMSVNSPFIGLLKADVCFCSFRMLRSTNINLPTPQMASLLEVIRVALDGVKFLTTMNHPWWNIVNTTFQSVCVLLSLATIESFAMIPHALETLKNITTTYDSHLSREALSTASALVAGARDKRSRELEALNQGLEVLGECSIPMTNEFDSGDGGGIEWLMDGEMGFGDLFDQTMLYSAMP